MALRKKLRRSSAATVPLLYAVIATAAGLSFPRIEASLWPSLVSSVSLSTATAIYSAIGSGMIALTGIVFSLAFVMVQFSATAYSPRLVLWIFRDPVLSHALGVFTATFLYAIAALTGLDRSGLQRAPLISGWLVVGLLFASVALFVSLIQRIGALQINRMLVFTGDLGRQAIRDLYGPFAAVSTQRALAVQPVAPVHLLIHHGRPRSLQTLDTAALVKAAKAYNVVIRIEVAVGDSVRESTPLMQVFGARCAIDEAKLRRAMELGSERTFEQDPKYAIRLLVDIAIRALSPAVNDPTTAVQALDQIEDLLLRLGRSQLDIGEYCDDQDKVRLVVPSPNWDDFLLLALDEILFYGATSTQVTRRMISLLASLKSDLPEDRKASIQHWEHRVRSTIVRSVADDEERLEASIEDRQGLGAPSRRFAAAGVE